MGDTFISGGAGAPRASAPRYSLRIGAKTTPVVETMLIGRAHDCALRLTSGLVSRHHARVRVEGDELRVVDLESRNGVLVNDRRIKGDVTVGHGDRLQIGIAVFEVVDHLILDHDERLSTMPPPSLAIFAPVTDALHDDVDTHAVTLPASVASLSSRERELLELIARGYAHKEIADHLHISVKTVESHRANIAEKLGCTSRAELVAHAIAGGMLTPSVGKLPIAKSGFSPMAGAGPTSKTV